MKLPTISKEALDQIERINKISQHTAIHGFGENGRKSADEIFSMRLPNYEAESAANTELLVDKMNELIDTQNKMIEVAEYDRQLAEQRYRDNIKAEKKSFILSAISVAAAAIAALGVLFPFFKFLIGCIA